MGQANTSIPRGIGHSRQEKIQQHSMDKNNNFIPVEGLSEAWHHRNNTLHSQQGSEVQTYQQEATINKIRRLYGLASKMRASDRVIFYTPIEEIIKKPMQICQDWINTHKEWIKQACQHTVTQEQATYRDIRTFY